MKYKHIILGGTGHIGSTLADELLRQHEPVLMIGHDPDKAAAWIAKGAEFEVTNILDTDKLKQLFNQGERIFILNPPAPPATDTVEIETKSVRSILAALDNTYLQKIVAASTYGVQPGNDIGDLGVLWKLEQGLAKLGVPVAIIRSAYYMSNWDAFLPVAKKDGVLPSLYPADFKLPMVAPQDIGGLAARFLLDDSTGLHFIEGPEHYSPNDVAAAMSQALNKPVQVSVTPEAERLPSLKKSGFSDKAAEYMANMTRLTLADGFEVKNPIRGKTAIQEYMNNAKAQS